MSEASFVVCVAGLTDCRYWELKKEMASGSEPSHIRAILNDLRPLCAGLSLCGAGAGGFGVLVLKQDSSISDLNRAVDAINSGLPDVELRLSVHSVQLDLAGITSSFVSGTTDCIASYLL